MNSCSVTMMKWLQESRRNLVNHNQEIASPYLVFFCYYDFFCQCAVDNVKLAERISRYSLTHVWSHFFYWVNGFRALLTIAVHRPQRSICLSIFFFAPWVLTTQGITDCHQEKKGSWSKLDKQDQIFYWLARLSFKKQDLKAFQYPRLRKLIDDCL